METIGRFFRNLYRRVAGKPLVEEEVPTYTFYETIEEFGYHFNEDGQLVDEDGGAFNYFVKEDRGYNQQRYDALGELVTEYMYNKMETDFQLQKVFIPMDATKEEPQGFMFQSSDAAQCQTLMVIINGLGLVRAGQWSRKLIINEGLEVGSQFPYIRRAQEAGYGVVLLNTNENQQMVNGKAVKIRGSGTAEEHGLYVWEHIISKTAAANIIIVAHSYGGIVTCAMVDRFLEDFQKRVFCVVFTDSVHTVERDRWSQPVKQFLKERAVNFAAAFVPIDYMMQASHPDNCLSVSAGTEDHGRTSHACIDSAFRFIQDNLVSWTTDGTRAPGHFKPLPEDLSEFSCAKRWQRMTEREEAAGSSPADKPAPETKKRRAEDAHDEESLSKNEGAQEGRQPGGRPKEEGKDLGSVVPSTESKEKDVHPEPEKEQEEVRMKQGSDNASTKAEEQQSKTEDRHEETTARKGQTEDVSSASQEDMGREEVVTRDREPAVTRDTEEVATTDTQGAISGDTQEAIIGDTQEAIIGDTQEAIIGDTQEAIIGDKQEAIIGDTQEAIIGDTQEAIIGDTQEAIIGNTQEAVIGDTQEAVIGDTQEAIIGDTQEAAIGDTQEAAIGDTQEAIIGDTQKAIIGDTQQEAIIGDTQEAATKDAPEAVTVGTEAAVAGRNEETFTRDAQEAITTDSQGADPGSAEAAVTGNTEAGDTRRTAEGVKRDTEEAVTEDAEATITQDTKEGVTK